jgi:hypothetical protein
MTVGLMRYINQAPLAWLNNPQLRLEKPVDEGVNGAADQESRIDDGFVY